MGATTFETTAIGKTVQEAFQTAKEAAYWECGHGGYTGTIAEKPGFVEIELPASKDVTWLLKAIDAYEQIAWSNQPGYSGDRAAYDKAVKEADAKRRQLQDESELAEAFGASRARSIYETYNDKWGDCLAVKVDDKTWRFFGWASC